ncbi:unnamed protein product [Pedinophyceae sp. YPF-701]|nr:unnamed protein product [Pedinophyceae sp. YPF-701]
MAASGDPGAGPSGTTDEAAGDVLFGGRHAAGTTDLQPDECWYVSKNGKGFRAEIQYMAAEKPIKVRGPTRKTVSEAAEDADNLRYKLRHELLKHAGIALDARYNFDMTAAMAAMLDGPSLDQVKEMLHMDAARGRKASSSRFKGVSWDKAGGKWRVRLTVPGAEGKKARELKACSLDSEIEAAEAYDLVAMKIHGRKADVNFAYDSTGDGVADIVPEITTSIFTSGKAPRALLEGGAPDEADATTTLRRVDLDELQSEDLELATGRVITNAFLEEYAAGGAPATERKARGTRKPRRRAQGSETASSDDEGSDGASDDEPVQRGGRRAAGATPRADSGWAEAVDACRWCGKDHFSEEEGIHPDTMLCCELCGEGQAHVSCHESATGKKIDSLDDDWFCTEDCTNIAHYVDTMCDIQQAVTADDGSKLNGVFFEMLSDDSTKASNKSAAALLLDAFQPVDLDGYNLVELVATSMPGTPEDDIPLDCSGFRLFVLRRRGVIVCVAAVRFFSNAFAEMPFIATREAHRGKGNARLLVSQIEALMIELNVQKLVVPAMKEVYGMWTKGFGFARLTAKERRGLQGRVVEPDESSAVLLKKSVLDEPRKSKPARHATLKAPARKQAAAPPPVPEGAQSLAQTADVPAAAGNESGAAEVPTEEKPLGEAWSFLLNWKPEDWVTERPLRFATDKDWQDQLATWFFLLFLEPVFKSEDDVPDAETNYTADNLDLGAFVTHDEMMYMYDLVFKNAPAGAKMSQPRLAAFLHDYFGHLGVVTEAAGTVDADRLCIPSEPGVRIGSGPSNRALGALAPRKHPRSWQDGLHPDLSAAFVRLGLVIPEEALYRGIMVEDFAGVPFVDQPRLCLAVHGLCWVWSPDPEKVAGEDVFQLVAATHRDSVGFPDERTMHAALTGRWSGVPGTSLAPFPEPTPEQQSEMPSDDAVPEEALEVPQYVDGLPPEIPMLGKLLLAYADDDRVLLRVYTGNSRLYVHVQNTGTVVIVGAGTVRTVASPEPHEVVRRGEAPPVEGALGSHVHWVRIIKTGVPLDPSKPPPPAATTAPGTTSITYTRLPRGSGEPDPADGLAARLPFLPPALLFLHGRLPGNSAAAVEQVPHEVTGAGSMDMSP